MALFGFDRETMLDLTVNFIPLGILAFFIVAFAVVPAFGFDPVFSGLQFSLMLSMFFLLALLTYYAGLAIQGAEEEEGDIESATAVNEPPGETEAIDDRGPQDTRERDLDVSDDGETSHEALTPEVESAVTEDQDESVAQSGTESADADGAGATSEAETTDDADATSEAETTDETAADGDDESTDESTDEK